MIPPASRPTPIPGARRIVLVFAAALAASACGAGTGGGGAGAPSPSGDAGTSGTDGDTADLEALYRARTDSARMRFSEADLRFMTGMIGHHAQALRMAGLAAENTSAREIRTLAARITNAQRDEIQSMQRWLRDRGQRVPEVDDAGEIEGALPEYAMHMPGMLTPEEMNELERARGRAFDRLFLRLMIQHHEGAVTAVHELFATDGAARDDVVFRLASDIQVDQITEVARMERMLEQLEATSR